VTLTDGTYTVLYRSVDYVNNVEAVQQIQLQIDTVPPVVTLSTNQAVYTRLESVVVQAGVTDPTPGSGVADFQVWFGTQAVVNGQTLATFWLPTGTYTLTATAHDNAGWGTRRTSSFAIIATLESLRATILRLRQLGEIDNAGITQSLLAKVDAASAAVGRGQPEVARNQLDALLHELAAQGGHHLTVRAADLLSGDTSYVQAHLP